MGQFDGIKCCVVGSGFFGSVIAERISSELSMPVLVIEKRNHIGGNSWSEPDPLTGIDVHRYGSHIFHTLNQDTWDYVNKFSVFNSYRHKVWTMSRGIAYSMPINLETINKFYGKSFTPAEADAWIESEIIKAGIFNPINFEEKAISLIGKPLYEAFIKGYSTKQWNTPLQDLPASIINRLPVRFSYNNHYFDDDSLEGIPSDGYGTLFQNMLKSKLISIKLNTDFFEIQNELPPDCLIVYSGPIDRFYNYQFGALGWRTLDFEREHIATRDFQGTAVMNYADEEIPYTRIHEFKHFNNLFDDTELTVIFREYSRAARIFDEPFYPINTKENRASFLLYEKQMRAERNVIFGGRLASYKYLDMDQVIGAALLCYRNTVEPRLLNVNKE